MADRSIPRAASLAGQVSCAVVLVLMLATFAYVTVTAIAQYNNIGV